MNTSRFLYGGLKLGEAEIMGKRGLNGTSVLSLASRQFSAANSPHANNASNKAQQISANFTNLKGQIPEALKLAQQAGGAGCHAVSCGWLIGSVHGCCKYGLQDVPSSQLMKQIINAAGHAKELSRTNNSTWNHGTIDNKFGPIAEKVGGLAGANALKTFAPGVNTLASQFAASLR